MTHRVVSCSLVASVLFREVNKRSTVKKINLLHTAASLLGNSVGEFELISITGFDRKENCCQWNKSHNVASVIALVSYYSEILKLDRRIGLISRNL